MIEWRETGTLLAVRPHGEAAAIVEIFTRDHGRTAGVVRGGGGRRMAPVLQPGTVLDATWKARLDAHIGAFTVEPVRARAAAILGDPLALAGLSSVCVLLTSTLPEREVCERLYDRTEAVLDLLMSNPVWPLGYLRWELALLEEIGFGLDLSACAATGTNEELIYVSPRSGRAVSRQGAGEWADRMLPLPPALLGEGNGAAAEIVAGLQTTGHFLERALGERSLPDARRRLADLLARQS